MSEISSFKGFIEGTQTQIDDITDKDIDKYYIVTDAKLATKEYVNNAVGGPVSPTVEVKTSTDTEYVLTVTDKDGSYDTPNLKGADGADGQQGIQGLKGDKGDTGEQGIQGVQGVKGADGANAQILKATDETDAESLSTSNPDALVWW